MILSYLPSAAAVALSRGRASRYVMERGGMLQLDFISAISAPELINKQNYTLERHSGGGFFINPHFLVSKKPLWLQQIRGSCWKCCRMLVWQGS